MKRILILLFILTSSYINAQVIGADMINRERKTTAQMNAITVAQGLKNGSEVLNSDTNTIWRYNGTIWEDTGSGGGGLQSTDIDTFAELDAIVADKSLAKLEDPQTFIGTKTFQDRTYFPNIEFTEITSLPLNSGIGTSSSRLQFRDATGNQPFSFNGDNLTAVRTYILPDTPGTIALNSNIPDNTDFVDLTSDQTNITGNKIFDELRVLDNGIGSFSNALEVSVPGGLNQSAFPHFIVDVDENEPGSSKINFLIDIGVPTYRVLEATASDLTYNGTSLLSGGGSSPPFDDNSPHIRDNLDNTKTITLVADNITTATNRNLTMPDADVDLGNMVSGPASATDNAIARFDTTTGKIIQNSTATLSDIGMLTASILTASTRYQGADQTDAAYAPGTSSGGIMFINNGMRLATGTNTNNLKLTYGALTSLGTLAFTDSDVTWNGSSLFGTDDQTASEVGITDAAGYYTGTDVEAMGQEIGSDLADRPTSLGTGRTNAVQYSDVFGQTLADYNTDGAGGAGDLIIITDASPAEVVATATIAMDGWKMYDDQTADAATITLSDCDPGETLTVYINRASAPTLAGTGLTFNQLPNTTAFAAATTMMIIFEVAYDGTTIDYYYVER